MGRADDGAIRSGTPAELLMERAGAAVARAAIRLAGHRYGGRVAVVCGKGNNGGDGFVAARILAREGMSVRCYSIADPADLHGAAAHHMRLYETLGGRVLTGPPDLSDADVIVDALFGTGFRGTAVDDAAKAIEQINAAPAPVVAVDIPSGVDGLTGRVDGPAVRADATVVMAAEKLGTVLAPGAQLAGAVEVADIGIPVDGHAHAFVLDPPESIPRREPTAHKRSAGSVVLLAGSDAMRGAALLAARGAQRIGSGYVTLGTTAAVKDAAHAVLPEALVTRAGDGDVLGPDALDLLGDAVEGAAAVAVGPGLGKGDAQRKLVERVLGEVPAPVVLDADGLNVLAEDPSPLSQRDGSMGEVVLTPHPAELARLLAVATDEVQADRPGHARAAADRFHAVVVLKGWRSMVARPGGALLVCPTGGPELATAGTGDVLTGAIAGLGGGHGGAGAAVYVHGLAGTIAGALAGRAGVVAWDVAEALPAAWERIAAGERDDWLS